MLIVLFSAASSSFAAAREMGEPVWRRVDEVRVGEVCITGVLCRMMADLFRGLCIELGNEYAGHPAAPHISKACWAFVYAFDAFCKYASVMERLGYVYCMASDEPVESVCYNSIDEDADGLVDCEDGNCWFYEPCGLPRPDPKEELEITFTPGKSSLALDGVSSQTFTFNIVNKTSGKGVGGESVRFQINDDRNQLVDDGRLSRYSGSTSNGVLEVTYSTPTVVTSDPWNTTINVQALHRKRNPKAYITVYSVVNKTELTLEEVIRSQIPLLIDESEANEDVQVHYHSKLGPDGNWYVLYVYEWKFSDAWFSHWDHDWDYEPVLVVLDKDLNYKKTIYDSGHYSAGATTKDKLKVVEGTHQYEPSYAVGGRTFTGASVHKLDEETLGEWNKKLGELDTLPWIAGGTGKVLSLDEAYHEPWNVEKSRCFTKKSE